MFFSPSISTGSVALCGMEGGLPPPPRSPPPTPSPKRCPWPSRPHAGRWVWGGGHGAESEPPVCDLGLVSFPPGAEVAVENPAEKILRLKASLSVESAQASPPQSWRPREVVRRGRGIQEVVRGSSSVAPWRMRSPPPRGASTPRRRSPPLPRIRFVVSVSSWLGL